MCAMRLIARPIGDPASWDQAQRKRYLRGVRSYLGPWRQAAKIISRHGHRRIAVRTLQACLAPDDRPSSRKCPVWLVNQGMSAYRHFSAGWQAQRLGRPVKLTQDDDGDLVDIAPASLSDLHVSMGVDSLLSALFKGVKS